MKIYFICDESGAKGSSRTDESYPGEVGVFAGYIVPETHFEQVNLECKRIGARYFDGEKPHLRGLTKDQMEAFRDEVFRFIEEQEIHCVYEAIHVRGFKAGLFDLPSQSYEEAKESRTSCIKLSSDRIDAESLHTWLFQGLFCRVIGTISDKYGANVSELEILVDEVNAKQLQEFCNYASEIVDPSTKVVNVSGWDPAKKEIVRGSIKFSSHPSLFFESSNLPKHCISIGPEHLIIPADVIANSIHHHFKSRNPDQIGEPLLTTTAIRHHPLSMHFWGLTDRPECGDSDSMFGYPKG